MADPDLELRITGPQGERLAAELTEVLESELGATPRRLAAPPPEPPPEPPREPKPSHLTTRGADPVAVAALVLALPAALLATVDLAQRLELKAKVDRFLAWVRRKSAEDPATRVEVVDGEGRVRRLDQVETSEVLEIAVQVSVRVTRKGGG